MNKENLRLYFKEFIKAEPSEKGLDKIKKNSNCVYDLFFYEPKNVEEARLGNLFMLGKIENISKNQYRSSDFLLNLLISVIKREFYSNPKRKVPEALEASLAKANLYLGDFAEKGNVGWIGNLHFICGVFYNNNLYITQVGSPIIKLIRETKISHLDKKFPSVQKPHPLKTFGNIASGSLSNGDKVILSTKNIFNLVSSTKLGQLSKTDSRQIVDYLKQVTKDQNKDGSPMVCLVLETKKETSPEKTSSYLAKNQPIPSELPSQFRGKNNLAKLRKIYSKIQPILSSFLIVFKKTAVAIIKIIHKTFILSLKIFRLIGKLLSPVTSTVKNLLKDFSQTNFFKLLSIGFKKRRVKFLNLIRWNKIKNTGLNTLAIIKTLKVKNLYQVNRPAFIVFVMLIILFLALPFVAANTIINNNKINHFNELTTEIKAVQKQADEALVYQEKEKAKVLLTKNQALISELIDLVQNSFNNNEEVSNKAIVILSKHQEQQDSINNVQRIEDMEEILDFSKSGFIVNPIGINKINNDLYFYELDSGILYKFKINNESTFEEKTEENKDLTLTFLSAKDELRKMVSLENGQIVLLGQSNKLYLYNSSTNDNKILSINPNIDVEDVIDIDNFFSNFYILTKDGIIKYSLQSQENNTVQGTEWTKIIKDQFNDAKSLAIDGSIFILNSNGTITEYYRGKKEQTIKLSLENPLGNNNKIFTKNDFNNLYLSDPDNKRIMVLNKNGDLINQYINDDFGNLTDFWVTNSEEGIYLLCGKKVYRIDNYPTK